MSPTMLSVGGGLATSAGLLWIVAALFRVGWEVWAILGATLIVASAAIARGLASRAGFWGWLAVRALVAGLVMLLAGQALGGQSGSSLQVVGLVIMWLTGLFAAIGARSSGEGGYVGPTLAIAGWLLIYIGVIIPVGSWTPAPFGLGWSLTGLHLVRYAGHEAR